jgi:aryl-alcohol dehydrogenase-like predicted oxidoreductase
MRFEWHFLSLRLEAQAVLTASGLLRTMTWMNFRSFGNTGINCSVVGLGTGRLASVAGGISRTAAAQLIGAAEDCGINLIDTADSYGQGECEKLLGHALQGKRSKFIVTTKAGYSFSGLSGGLRFIKPLAKKVVKYFKGGKNLTGAIRSNVSRQDFSVGTIRNGVESSLRRLQTDYLDIFLLHTPPLPVMAEPPLWDLLRQLQREGKIRHFGVSSHDPATLGRALQLPGLAAVQTPVNPLQAGQREILTRLQASNIGIVANQIFLSGKLLGSVVGSAAEEREHASLIARLNSLAQQKGISLNHLLIKYALSRPGVVSVLTGTNSPEHLKRNVADALSAHPILTETEIAAAIASVA